MLKPPAIKPTIPPGVTPGERRYSYRQLLDKPTPGTNPIALADIPGDVAAVDKFLRSLGTGTAANPPTWAQIVSADISDATDANTANKVVKRDGAGSFIGQTITAVGSFVGALSKTLTFGAHMTGASFNNSANVTIATDATNANTASTIVARDGAGGFSMGPLVATTVAASDQVSTTAAGKGYTVKSGANCKIGNGTLVGGAATIANTSVTANSVVLLVDQGGGVIGNIGSLYENVATRVPGTSFDVKSTNVLDSSNFGFVIVEKG